MFKKFFLGAACGLIFLLILFVVRGAEDSWLCTAEGWVKHGQPVRRQPAEPCVLAEGAVITDFAGCQAAGYPVMESYPRQCRTAAGRSFTEDIGNELEKQDLINLVFPRPNQKISSPLTISGRARGSWFFEASFPVKLTDASGQIISQGLAVAQGNWMTPDFVDFTAELIFGPVIASTGRLILVKDNPSALPENDDQLIVPVSF
ncbi:MAG: hypothetical protein UW98_C0046G0006 [Parcubacteria group bacterium GW2011_GWC2_45_15]|nr:MAG: hypothetical protein UW98_C0046G0006 [Parcubacteria group bacterium GW2011_GWC2_45_15]